MLGKLQRGAVRKVLINHFVNSPSSLIKERFRKSDKTNFVSMLLIKLTFYEIETYHKIALTAFYQFKTQNVRPL